MIKDLEFSIKNLGHLEGDGLVTPQSIQPIPSEYRVSQSQPTTPGWYWHTEYGYVYLHVNGTMYLGNPVTGQLYYPLWSGDFFPEFIRQASTIGGPINVVSGNTIELKWSFKWVGTGRDINFKFGNCKRIGTGEWFNAGDWEQKSVTVTTTTTPVTYNQTTTFVFRSASIWDNPHLFILPDGFQNDVVYLDAFTEVSADISDLKITTYSRLT